MHRFGKLVWVCGCVGRVVFGASGYGQGRAWGKGLGSGKPRQAPACQRAPLPAGIGVRGFVGAWPDRAGLLPMGEVVPIHGTRLWPVYVTARCLENFACASVLVPVPTRLQVKGRVHAGGSSVVPAQEALQCLEFPS